MTCDDNWTESNRTYALRDPSSGLHASVVLGGDTWVALTPIAAPFGSASVAADPFAPDTLYADAHYIEGMSKSTDGGKNWNVLPFDAQLLRKIIVEPSAPNRVTAMAWDLVDFSVYRSVDGVMTWVRHQFSGAVRGVLNDIAVDPLNSKVLYAAHARFCFISCTPDSGGVSKSSDGGDDTAPRCARTKRIYGSWTARRTVSG